MLHLSPGGAVGAIVFGWCTLMAAAPLRRPRRAAALAWLSSAQVCELPMLFAAVVLLSNAPDALSGVRWPDGWIAATVAVATIGGLLVVARRATTARLPLEQALDETLGRRWRMAAGGGLPPRRFWATTVRPLPVRSGSVERTRNISYGDRGSATTLDLYRSRSTVGLAPAFVHLHGGGFHWGGKSREARLLLHRMASDGWVSISANYTLSPTPSAGFPQHLVDVKRLLAWIHDQGSQHGIDPSRIVLSGSSAGAHLTTMAIVTADDPQYQPGFEGSSTSFTAGIGFYGYYGELGGVEGVRSTPLGYKPSGGRPFLAIHGTNDTFTPVEGARALVAHLRRDPTARVALAELEGAQHSFDVFRSVRYQTVVDAVAVFATHAGG